MQWLPIVMSIFGALEGASAGGDMMALGREQEKLAEKNALLDKRQLQEETRRQAAEDRRIRGSALARAAASGMKISGSVSASLEYLEEEQGRQLDWLKTAGASRIRLRLEAGKLAGKATQIKGRSQQLGSLFQGVSSAFGYANQGGMMASMNSSMFTRSWTPAITGPK